MQFRGIAVPGPEFFLQFRDLAVSRFCSSETLYAVPSFADNFYISELQVSQFRGSTVFLWSRNIHRYVMYVDIKCTNVRKRGPVPNKSLHSLAG